MTLALALAVTVRMVLMLMGMGVVVVQVLLLLLLRLLHSLLLLLPAEIEAHVASILQIIVRLHAIVVAMGLLRSASSLSGGSIVTCRVCVFN